MLLAALLTLFCAATPPSAEPRVWTQDPEEQALLAEALAEGELERRRGQFSAARRVAEELLREQPGLAGAQVLLARIEAETESLERGIEALGALLARPEARAAAERPEWVLDMASWLLILGRAQQAEALLAPERLDNARARTLWVRGELEWSLGRREEARAAWKLGSECRPQTWQDGLYVARCWRRLSRLEQASQALVAADELAKGGDGVEPDVLAELASLYFEADREVEDGSRRSAGQLYEEALRLHPTHEAATLGLYEIYRYNWLRQRRNAGEILAEFLSERPRSVPARLLALAVDLSDGNLPRVRLRLAELERELPARREVRTARAALYWIEHRREEAQALLAALERENPRDALPNRSLADHLCDLYRFGEAVAFARRATELDPLDHESFLVLGKALANTGDEKGGLAALDKAAELSGSRADAWRDNMRLVLKRMQAELVVRGDDELSFAWDPKAAEVLATYLVPFYREARADLAQRYGYTPGKTAIEVFHEHEDFSVRSTGFEGFPALGVCFGPVVTAVSPLSEMRGTFSWARTSFHEFSHVVHLGLSNNRCPRWITEGIATWEETRRNPSWSRNMRRELFDARANSQLIPSRELNAAFRTNRILFAYYQGGLMCEMWVASHGFPALVRMLEAFDKGLDLDQTFRSVLNQTPEEVDARFRAHVDRLLAQIRIEPRWEDAQVLPLRFSLPAKPPQDESALEEWGENWVRVAVHAWTRGKRLDAEEALRRLGARESRHPRASFLRGEMALAQGLNTEAKRFYLGGIEAGGEDFRARMALSKLFEADQEWKLALEHAQAAERAFPGYAEAELNAERAQMRLHERLGDEPARFEALSRWLDCESGDYAGRLELADWLLQQGRPREAAIRLEEANEIDPFRRKLHMVWAEALEACEDWAGAAREYGVVKLVPPELDADEPGPLSPAEQERIAAGLARCEERLAKPDLKPEAK
jgi:tetratricopeptide (TPR) repeat protein